MSFYRIGLVVLTGLFATVMAEAAFAGCGGCGGYAVTYAAYPPVQLVYAPPPVQPIVMVQPAPLPIPIAPAPIGVNNWDTNGWGTWGGCGCGNRGLLAYAAPVGPAATPFYVVNQGPEYSGPNFMIPFGAYSPQANLAVPGEYPYVGNYGYRRYPRGYGMYPRGYGMYPRYAYRHRYWRHDGYGYRRPLHARD